MQLKKWNMKGSESGSVNVSDGVFARTAATAEKDSDITPVHPQTITDVVKSQLNNERQGTLCTKTRAEVRGGGKKPWRQKGTGRARAGSTRSPLWPGGGATFGPRPRIYDHRPPKKVVDRALQGILTAMAANDRIHVVEGLAFETGKTKDVVAFMETHKLVKALFVVSAISDKTSQAVRNLKNVRLVTPLQVNAVDLLKYNTLAISDQALKTLEEALNK
ncbi:MAG: 50S ribosomal protein L4 [Candidatus Riflebacteria bacterium]|nr:50S ribosomal protein L4 [Candidatus Riflebacteria bacterium]